MVPVGRATLATVRGSTANPNGSPLALPFSEIGWNAFSKNRVKPAAAGHRTAAGVLPKLAYPGGELTQQERFRAATIPKGTH
jgi:hypothetical protein